MTAPPRDVSQQTSGAPKTSGLAIVALILGFTGLCTFGLGAIAGLILGIIAYSRINASGGLLKGRSVALAAIIISAIMIFVGIAVGLPMLGLLIFLRNDIKDWVHDTWDEARQDARQHHQDLFSDRPRSLSPLSRPDGPAPIFSLPCSGLVPLPW